MNYSESYITVRYAETDQMGVVHHAVYPVWFELARTDFMKQIGVSYAQIESLGVMLPVTDISCHYIRPARYEQQVTVRVFVQRLTPVRIGFTYELYHREELLAVGTSGHAWVDSTTFRPISLKKRLPDIYEKLSALAPKEKER